MTQHQGFLLFFDFFEFLMPTSKCDQNGRRDRSYVGIESLQTLDGSMMK
jgi:hypothetical protein